MEKINWLLVVVGVPLWLFSIYLFFFADCEMVKKYWYITYTPARCIQVAEAHTATVTAEVRPNLVNATWSGGSWDTSVTVL